MSLGLRTRPAIDWYLRARLAHCGGRWRGAHRRPLASLRRDEAAELLPLLLLLLVVLLLLQQQ